ncbi:MAG: three-helix bundle dimerization domain-containing protein [Candidatus Dormibacteraceae bacterium]
MSVAFDERVLKMVESEVRTIKAQYRGVVSEESIDSMAHESLQRLADSRVPQFVPLFVGRFMRDRIKQIVSSPRGPGAPQSETETS